MSLADSLMAGALGQFLRSRRLARTPIAIYRAGFGWIFGTRMLMLEHLGRRTGARRYVVLEVADRPASDRFVVPSGFGRRAQWFRNVEASPRVKVSIGRRRSVPAEARVLSDEDADAALQSYIQRHPRSWAALEPTIEAALGRPVTVPGAGVPMVELRLLAGAG